MAMNRRDRMRQRLGTQWRSSGNSVDATREDLCSSVDLRIERLVLSGGNFTAREPIADVVQSELANLFAERGFPTGGLGGSRDRIEAGTIALEHGMRAEAVGREIARSIYGGLSVVKRVEPLKP
jgi:hypothetical protein